MPRTMSCGELKDTTFTGNINSKNMADILLSKSKIKPDDVEGDNSSGQSPVYQIKPGARIVKLDDEDSYKSFRAEIAKKMGKPESSIDFNKDTLEGLLTQLNGVYDGVMVSDKLAGKFQDPFLNESGLRVLNPEVVVNIREEKLEPYMNRDSFNAYGTDVSKTMRELSSDLYNSRDYYLDASARYDNIYSRFARSDEKYFYNGVEITSSYNDAKNDIQQQFGDSVIIDEKNYMSGVRDGVVRLSSEECMKISSICHDIGYYNVDLKDTMSALKSYYEESEKIPYGLDEQALNKFKGVISYEKTGVDEFGKDMHKAYATSDQYSSVSKEKLHKEKQAWDRVISKTPDDKKEIVKEIAKVYMCRQMNEHINVRKGNVEPVYVGDMRIEIKNSRATTEKSSSNGERLQSISNRLESLKSSHSERMKGKINDSALGKVYKKANSIISILLGK